METLEAEVEEYVKDIEGDGSTGRGLTQIFFPTTTASKLLNYIAGFFGNPPDTFRDEDFYRKPLSLMVRISKYKGTEEGLKRFFGIFGIVADIVVTLFEGVKYDD